MKIFKKSLKYINKSPLLYSIVIMIILILITSVIMIISMIIYILIKRFIHLAAGAPISLTEIKNKKIIDFLSTLCTVISTIFIVFISKKMKIYTKGGFFKTLKLSTPYIAFYLLTFIIPVINAINENQQFKPATLIIINLIDLIKISFIEESLFRGLIASKFAQKYIDRKYGILKSILFPSLIFGIAHMVNITANIKISYCIMQVIFGAIVGILFTTIYFLGENIFPLIVAHTITNACAGFNSGFLNNNISKIEEMNRVTFNFYNIIEIIFLLGTELIYIYIIFKKIGIEKVKDSIRKINS